MAARLHTGGGEGVYNERTLLRWFRVSNCGRREGEGGNGQAIYTLFLLSSFSKKKLKIKKFFTNFSPDHFSFLI